MQTVFEKVEKAYKLVQKEVKVNKEELFRALGRFVNKAQLTKEQLIVCETLLQHKYNLNTVYRWLLAVNTPKISRKSSEATR